MPKRRFSRRKRPTKWICGSAFESVETPASLSTTELIHLVPSFTDDDNLPLGDATILGGDIHLNYTRVLTTAVGAFGYVVALQEVDSVGVALQRYNPISVDAFELASKNIMKAGCLPVPANDRLFDGGPVISGELVDQHIHLGTMRKIGRSRQSLVLTLAADISLVINVQVTWRILLGY